jgi:hypothetical protein
MCRKVTANRLKYLVKIMAINKMNADRRVRYTDEERANLVRLFIDAFRADKRPFRTKLAFINMSKGCYSTILNGTFLPKKKTMHKMRFFLKGQQSPIIQMNTETHFFCSGCEQILTKDKRSLVDKWTCRACRNTDNYKNKLKNWPHTLKLRRARNLKRKYGSYASCMRLILEIRKEIRDNE